MVLDDVGPGGREGEREEESVFVLRGRSLPLSHSAIRGFRDLKCVVALTSCATWCPATGIGTVLVASACLRRPRRRFCVALRAPRLALPFSSSLSSLSFILAAGPCYCVCTLITNALAQPEAARTGKGSAVRVSQLPLAVRRVCSALACRCCCALTCHCPAPATI